MAKVDTEKQQSNARNTCDINGREQQGKGDETERLAFDEQYLTFARQPDHRYFSLPQHVDVTFEEMFSSPNIHRKSAVGKGIGDTVVERGFRCIFTYTMDVTFYTLTVIIGFFLSLVWGIVFGLVSFFVIWLIQPFIKTMYIFVRIFGSIYSTGIRTFLDPLFQSYGLCFSYFRLRLNFLPIRSVNQFDELVKEGHTLRYI